MRRTALGAYIFAGGFTLGVETAQENFPKLEVHWPWGLYPGLRGPASYRRG